MEVRAGHLARGAGFGYDVAHADALPAVHEYLGAVGIESLPVVLVLYYDVVAVARIPADERDGAVGKALDVGAAPDGEVGAVVELDLVVQRVQPVAKAA